MPRASWTQALADWIGAHTRAFAALGGVPNLLIPVAAIRRLGMSIFLPRSGRGVPRRIEKNLTDGTSPKCCVRRGTCNTIDSGGRAVGGKSCPR